MTRRPIHRDDLYGVAPRLVAVCEPGLECLFRAALDHVQQALLASVCMDRGEIEYPRSRTCRRDGYGATRMGQLCSS